MKKMAAPIIFLLILSLLVFAGCSTFSIDMNPSDNTDEPATQSTEPIIYYVPQTDANGEVVTDAQGENIYVPESQNASDEPATILVPETDAQGEQVTDTEGSTKMISVTESTKQVYVPVTDKKGEKVTNTEGSNVYEPATKPTTEPAKQSYDTEYDIFRSGKFHMKGSMMDSSGTTPMEIAITDDSVYMLTDFEGMDMAILVNNGKTYLIYPAEKGYLKLSSVLMGMIGLDTDELLDTESLGFTEMAPLSQADSVQDTTYNGKSCKVYTFVKSDGSKSAVYINGNTLYALETLTASGAVSTTTVIDYITDEVPDDKINPPDYYRELSLTEFMKLFGATE